MNKLPCVLSIAGTDPSGGAGIQADIKAVSATGAYAATVITALVAQNTQGVQAIESIPSAFVHQQIESVFNDLSIDAVKIGMLQDERIITVVAQALESYRPNFLVLDPVMIAKDGSKLLNLNSILALKKRIFPLSYLITPNLFEAEHLLDESITTKTKMENAAIRLGKEHQLNVLLKGGHLENEEADDVLFIHHESRCVWFSNPRVHTSNTHGTGCSLSAAIASYLAQGCTLLDAVEKGKIYLTQAILAGKELSIGKGNGPVDHFFFLRR